MYMHKCVCVCVCGKIKKKMNIIIHLDTWIDTLRIGLQAPDIDTM